MKIGQNKPILTNATSTENTGQDQRSQILAQINGLNAQKENLNKQIETVQQKQGDAKAKAERIKALKQEIIEIDVQIQNKMVELSKIETKKSESSSHKSEEDLINSDPVAELIFSTDSLYKSRNDIGHLQSKLKNQARQDRLDVKNYSKINENGTFSNLISEKLSHAKSLEEKANYLHTQFNTKLHKKEKEFEDESEEKETLEKTLAATQRRANTEFDESI